MSTDVISVVGSADPVDGLSPTDLFDLPGVVERTLAVVTFFVLTNGLPIDWFQTRDDWQAQDGNLFMIVVQLALMGLAVGRVVGSLDWLLRIFRTDATVFLLPALAFLSMMWSTDPGESLRQAVVLSTITAYGAYLVLRFELADIIEMWALAFLATAVANLYFVFRLPIYGVYGDSWSGVYNGKNPLGFVALIAIPVLVAAARNRSPRRMLYYPAAAVFALLLAGSLSKTMLIATTGTVGLTFIYSWFRGRKTMRGVAYLCLLTAIGVMITLTIRNLPFVTELLDKDVTFTGRIPLWENLLPIAADRPLTGYGYQAVFTGYFGPIHEIWIVEDWNPSHAHNELLNLWLQLGIGAVAIYLVMMVRSIRRAVAVIALVPGPVAIWPLTFLTSAVLVSITESGMSHAPIGWLMLVVAVLSAGHYYKTESPTE